MPKKNKDNLIPIRSEKEAREKGKKGGIRSGEVRREKKALRDTFEELLKVTLKDENLLESYKQFGFDKKGMTMQDAISAAMIHQAAKGNVKAFKAIYETIEVPKLEEKEKVITDRMQLMQEAFEKEDGVEDDGDE